MRREGAARTAASADALIPSWEKVAGAKRTPDEGASHPASPDDDLAVLHHISPLFEYLRNRTLPDKMRKANRHKRLDLTC